MSNADFWAKQLGGQAPPPHIQQPAPPQSSAWWAPTPLSSHLQAPVQQAYQGDPSMQPSNASWTYEELKRMRADEMSQEQMEVLAEFELQAAKYQQTCPNCGAGGFIRQGDKVGGYRFGTDRCFECGAGASTLTASPEPAVGATGSRANSIHTRQTANGGAVNGNYGRHYSELPASYIPRNV